MAQRRQLLGELETSSQGRRGGNGKRPKQEPYSPPAESPRYPPEVKAKAYRAFLEGKGWADCARAIGHPEPNGSGTQLICRWAEDDNWVRPIGAGDYKASVQRELDKDPEHISDEIDQLAVQMQRVLQKYIMQYIDSDTGEVMELGSSFKTRDFADTAAALRMTHETRIKIRKSLEKPEDKKNGGGRDLLSTIREAGLNRLRDNKRRSGILPKAPEPEEEEKEEELTDVGIPETSDTPSGGGTEHSEPSDFPDIASLRARLERELGASGGEAESLEADTGTDGE